MKQVYIVVTGDQVGELVGTFDHRLKRLANGDFVKIEDYPELFQKIGYTFGPPPYKYTEPSFIKRYFFGVKPRRYRNPDFRPGYFRLPDALRANYPHFDCRCRMAEVTTSDKRGRNDG